MRRVASVGDGREIDQLAGPLLDEEVASVIDGAMPAESAAVLEAFEPSMRMGPASRGPV
jgi:hypothetical protein